MKSQRARALGYSQQCGLETMGTAEADIPFQRKVSPYSTEVKGNHWDCRFSEDNNFPEDVAAPDEVGMDRILV